jgi:hypothetical protein
LDGTETEKAVHPAAPARFYSIGFPYIMLKIDHASGAAIAAENIRRGSMAANYFSKCRMFRFDSVLFDPMPSYKLVQVQ